MDFHIATPDGDLYLFSAEQGRAFCLLQPPPVGAPPAPVQPELHREITQAKKEPVAIRSGSF